MDELRIDNNKVVRIVDKFTASSFAEAVGVHRCTVYGWIKDGTIDLNQSPYEVICQFFNKRTKCTKCRKQSEIGMGIERWCQHCGTARLKIGVTYYHDHVDGDDGNDGVTYKTAFWSSSKAMCRARKLGDRIVNVRAR